MNVGIPKTSGVARDGAPGKDPTQTKQKHSRRKSGAKPSLHQSPHERTTYMRSGGIINGLHANPKPDAAGSVRRTKGQLQGVPRRMNDTDIAGEMMALREVVSEENKTKDQLLEMVIKRCTKAEARVEHLDIECAKMERNLEAIRHDAGSAQRNQDALVQENHDANHQLSLIGEDLVFEREERKKAEGKLDQANRQIQDLQRQLSTSQTETRSARVTLQATTQHMESDLQAARAKFEEEQNYRCELEAQYRASRADIEEFEREKNNLVTRNDTLEAQNAAQVHATEALNTQLVELKKAYADSKGQKDRLNNVVSALRRRETSLKQELNAKTNDDKNALNGVKEMRERVTKFQRQLQQRDKKVAVLEAKANRSIDEAVMHSGSISELETENAKLKEKCTLLKQRYNFVEHLLKEERGNRMQPDDTNKQTQDGHFENTNNGNEYENSNNYNNASMTGNERINSDDNGHNIGHNNGKNNGQNNGSISALRAGGMDVIQSSLAGHNMSSMSETALVISPRATHKSYSIASTALPNSSPILKREKKAPNKNVRALSNAGQTFGRRETSQNNKGRNESGRGRTDSDGNLYDVDRESMRRSGIDSNGRVEHAKNSQQHRAIPRREEEHKMGVNDDPWRTPFNKDQGQAKVSGTVGMHRRTGEGGRRGGGGANVKYKSATGATRKAKVIPDPALAADSDAPDWMKF